jgi:AmmeMemoRadiSam system protein A
MDAYVKLAKSAVESFVKTGKFIKLDEDLPQELLTDKAGVFVSIKKNGSLRGCIGTIGSTKENIGEEIIRNALSAALDDPRFPPVAEGELGHLTYSVDVLSPPESISSAAMLDVTKYGVIVTCGMKRGLLLPNLEGIDDVETQVSIALRKAGIGADEGYWLERFQVVRHL